MNGEVLVTRKAKESWICRCYKSLLLGFVETCTYLFKQGHDVYLIYHQLGLQAATSLQQVVLMENRLKSELVVLLTGWWKTKAGLWAASPWRHSADQPFKYFSAHKHWAMKWAKVNLILFTWQTGLLACVEKKRLSILEPLFLLSLLFINWLK